MKIKTLPYLFVCLLAIILLSSGCNKSGSDASLATINTYPVIGAVTATSAQAYAYATSAGGGTISAVGICWSATNQAPTINDSKASRAVDTVNFALNLTALSPNTTYYVRGYATNQAGTAYGNTVTFKTNTSTFALTATVSTLAGTGAPGYVDGLPAIAQLSYPLAMCADSQGNIYVADFYNNVIRKITPAGVTSTYAGNGTLGYVDGPAATAEFNTPQGITIDAQGNLYVTDMGNSLIRKISAAGIVSTIAGRGYTGYADGTGTAAVFNVPSGIAVDGSGNLYVADRGNNMIRMITPAGVVTTLAGITTAGQIDGTGTAAGFSAPVGITYDSKNSILYVSDLNNNAIRSVTPAGVVSTVIGSNLISSVIGAPWGICVDASGNVYATDINGRVLELSTSHILYSLAGTSGTAGFVNGTNASALFSSPRGICVNSSGTLYVSEYGNHAIRKIVLTTTP